MGVQYLSVNISVCDSLVFHPLGRSRWDSGLYTRDPAGRRKRLSWTAGSTCEYRLNDSKHQLSLRLGCALIPLFLGDFQGSPGLPGLQGPVGPPGFTGPPVSLGAGSLSLRLSFREQPCWGVKAHKAEWTLWPGWGGAWGRVDTMYMYGWVPLLSTGNSHNVAHQPCSKIKSKAGQENFTQWWALSIRIQEWISIF